MPRKSGVVKDLFHDAVKEALMVEGWQITHDPFPLAYGDVQMQIDLGAERLLAAERALLNMKYDFRV